jgi:N-acylneuraminate cytidylyltransferase
LVQATSPFTQTSDFYEALETFKRQKADSLLTCVRSKRFIWDKSGAPINYDYKNRPRRQEFQGSLIENGAFYINTIGNIRKSKNRLHGNIAIYEMKEFTFIEIDEEDDWLFAEKIMNKYILKNYET